MAPFLIENSRGLVPLSSLSGLLPRFLGAPVNFHESSRRLFVGDVGIQISFQLDASNPPRLVLNFQRSGESDDLHRTGQAAHGL